MSNSHSIEQLRSKFLASQEISNDQPLQRQKRNAENVDLPSKEEYNKLKHQNKKLKVLVESLERTMSEWVMALDEHGQSNTSPLFQSFIRNERYKWDQQQDRLLQNMQDSLTTIESLKSMVHYLEEQDIQNKETIMDLKLKNQFYQIQIQQTRSQNNAQVHDMYSDDMERDSSFPTRNEQDPIAKYRRYQLATSLVENPKTKTKKRIFGKSRKNPKKKSKQIRQLMELLEDRDHEIEELKGVRKMLDRKLIEMEVTNKELRGSLQLLGHEIKEKIQTEQDLVGLTEEPEVNSEDIIPEDIKIDIDSTFKEWRQSLSETQESFVAL